MSNDWRVKVVRQYTNTSSVLFAPPGLPERLRTKLKTEEHNLSTTHDRWRRILEHSPSLLVASSSRLATAKGRALKRVVEGEDHGIASHR